MPTVAENLFLQPQCDNDIDLQFDTPMSTLTLPECLTIVDAIDNQAGGAKDGCGCQAGGNKVMTDCPLSWNMSTISPYQPQVIQTAVDDSQTSAVPVHVLSQVSPTSVEVKEVQQGGGNCPLEVSTDIDSSVLEENLKQLINVVSGDKKQQKGGCKKSKVLKMKVSENAAQTGGNKEGQVSGTRKLKGGKPKEGVVEKKPDVKESSSELSTSSIGPISSEKQPPKKEEKPKVEKKEEKPKVESEKKGDKLQIYREYTAVIAEKTGLKGGKIFQKLAKYYYDIAKSKFPNDVATEKAKELFKADFAVAGKVDAKIKEIKDKVEKEKVAKDAVKKAEKEAAKKEKKEAKKPAMVSEKSEKTETDTE